MIAHNKFPDTRSPIPHDHLVTADEHFLKQYTNVVPADPNGV